MLTLEQAKVGMADKVDQMVVDEFRRGSWLLDHMEFDNSVSPGTGGSTLAYGYVKLKTPATAAFRALNTEYTPGVAIREKQTAYCKIFGGDFPLDRVIISTSGSVDELDFQLREKVKGAINLFHYTAINGDAAVNEDEFDGLDVFLTGSSTEYNAGSTIDVSSAALTEAQVHKFLDMMDDFTSGLDDAPTAFLGNKQLINRLKGIARRAGYFTRVEDAFGRPVSAWNDIPLIDLKQYYDGALGKSRPVVPVSDAGITSLYAVTLARDGFHGISPTGNDVIKTALPDLAAPGVVKSGDVEMVAGVVLKNSLKAGVFRDIRVQ